VDKAGHLLVCDSENHRIQVFVVSGKFVAKFGSKGSGIGKFKAPISAAVLSDGKIVVSDNRNKPIANRYQDLSSRDTLSRKQFLIQYGVLRPNQTI